MEDQRGFGKGIGVKRNGTFCYSVKEGPGPFFVLFLLANFSVPNTSSYHFDEPLVSRSILKVMSASECDVQRLVECISQSD